MSYNVENHPIKSYNNRGTRNIFGGYQNEYRSNY